MKADFVHRVYTNFGQTVWWQGNQRADQGSFENVHKFSDLKGMKVNDTSGKSLGTVNNVGVDLETGRILYVFLEPAHDLNLAKDLYPMPPDALTLGSDKKSLTSNLTREKLASAPAVQGRTWSQVADTIFASQVYRHYGKQPWFCGSLTPTGRSQTEVEDGTDEFFGNANNNKQQKNQNRQSTSDNREPWQREDAAGWGTPR